MSSEILIGAVGFTSAVLSFFQGRRMSKAQTKNYELDATEKAIKIWRELTEDLRKEVEKLRTEIDEITFQFEDKCKRCKYKKKTQENGEN